MKKVLIVDDDEVILDAISLVLEDAEYIVEKLRHPQHIYERIKLFQPAVILLDILMSGSDGREICKQLKKDPDTLPIPVILVAARPNLKKEAETAGADDFLAKPFDIADLLAKVEKHI